MLLDRRILLLLVEGVRLLSHFLNLLLVLAFLIIKLFNFACERGDQSFELFLFSSLLGDTRLQLLNLRFIVFSLILQLHGDIVLA